MIRAAAYIRVSTERQAEEDKVSLDEQSKDIAAYFDTSPFMAQQRQVDLDNPTGSGL